MDQSAILGKFALTTVQIALGFASCNFSVAMQFFPKSHTRSRLVQFFCCHAIFSQIAHSSMRLPIQIIMSSASAWSLLFKVWIAPLNKCSKGETLAQSFWAYLWNANTHGNAFGIILLDSWLPISLSSYLWSKCYFSTFVWLGDVFHTRANISAPKIIHTVLITYWKWCENLKLIHWIYTIYLVKGFSSKKVKGLHLKS